MIASSSRIIHRGHAEVLGPLVENLLLSTQTRIKNLSKIAVCSGPGSFTGVRVGLSFAKGLALPWAIPVVGVSGLEVWAFEVDPEGQKNVMAIADVRRGEVFWQKFEKGQTRIVPSLTDIDLARKALSSGDEIVGNGAPLIGGSRKSGVIPAALVAWIALERSVKTHPAEPLYHRPPDAKLPGGRTL